MTEYRTTYRPITIGILFNREYEDLGNLLKSLKFSIHLIKEILIFSNGIVDPNKLLLVLSNIPLTIRGCVRLFNFGASYGRNWLVKFCKTKYIVFCDADLTVNPDTIDVIYETIKRYNNIYAVVPKMYFGGTRQYWFNGKYNKHYHNTIDKGIIDTGDNIKLRLGNMITTCVIIDVDKFKENNLWFDNEFFIYHEDISNTAFNKKVFCIFQPNAIAYHNVELNVKHFDKFRHYLMFRNGIIMGIKRFDIIGLIILFRDNIVLKLQPVRLKIRAILYGLKIGLIKLFRLFDGKLIDTNEFKFVQRLSKHRVILR